MEVTNVHTCKCGWSVPRSVEVVDCRLESLWAGGTVDCKLDSAYSGCLCAKAAAWDPNPNPLRHILISNQSGLVMCTESGWCGWQYEGAKV